MSSSVSASAPTAITTSLSAISIVRSTAISTSLADGGSSASDPVINALCTGTFFWNPSSSTPCTAGLMTGIKCESSTCPAQEVIPECTPAYSAGFYNTTICTLLDTPGKAFTNASFQLGADQPYAGVIVSQYSNAECTGNPIAGSYYILQLCGQLDKNVFGYYGIDHMNNIYVTRFSDPGCTTLLGTPNTFVPAGCSDKSTTVLYFYKGLTAFYTYTDSTCKTVSQMSYSFSWGPCVVDAKCTKSSISNMFTQYAACYPSRKSIDFASISKKSFGVQPYIVMDSYYDENCGYAPYSRYEYLLNSCFNSTRSVSSFMFTPNGTEAVSYVSWSQFGCTGKNTTSPVYSNSVDCNKKQKLYIFNMNATATATKYVPSTNILNPTSAARNIITNIFLIVILILSH